MGASLQLAWTQEDEGGTTMSANTLRPNQLHILQHSLGVDRYGLGARYRNHFVTDVTSQDGIECMELVSLGLMTHEPSRGEISGGMSIFRVTPAGVSVMMIDSPKPPKVTRSQRRYQQYLDADSGMSFKEWLKRGGR
jgi:hypothetical protein